MANIFKFAATPHTSLHCELLVFSRMTRVGPVTSRAACKSVVSVLVFSECNEWHKGSNDYLVIVLTTKYILI